MPFQFDPTTGRYRQESGRFVPDASVRGALDTVLERQVETARGLTQDLIDGRLVLADWQREMMTVIRESHLLGTSLANGGWAELTKADFGWTGQRIRAQYRYLSNFAAQLADGRQALDGTAVARAGMYAEAARATHRAAQARAARDRGMEQERNVLGAAEQHCGECPSESMRGWVPIGSLIPVGSRQCLSRCKCHIEWRLAPVAAEAA